MLALLTSAALAACPAIALSGTSAPDVAHALRDRGITTPPADDSCAPVSASVTPHASGGLAVTVRSPQGPGDLRVVPTPDVAAAWLASATRDDLYADLVHTDVDGLPRVRLFATLDGLIADQPVAELQVEVFEQALEGRIGGRDGVPPLVTVDQRLRQARESTRAYAVEIDGEVYVNDTSPWPKRSVQYGRLERIGGFARYPQWTCHWVAPTEAMPGHTQCDLQVKLLDLATGTAEVVTPKKLKRWMGDSDLRDALDAEGPKHAGVVWRHTGRLLEARAAAAR